MTEFESRTFGWLQNTVVPTYRTIVLPALDRTAADLETLWDETRSAAQAFVDEVREEWTEARNAAQERRESRKRAAQDAKDPQDDDTKDDFPGTM